MENNELKNKVQKNVKENIAISNIRKELDMERRKNKKIFYGILSTCAVFVLCGVVLINYHQINKNDIVNEQAKLENIENANTENLKIENESKVEIKINQMGDSGAAKLDADIKILNNTFMLYFEFLKEVKIPSDFDNTKQYSVWTRKTKTGDYDILNSYEFYYYNTKDNRNIKLSFSDEYQPIRDYYFDEDSATKSIIRDCELVIYQYENSYMTVFTYHNVNFDIETIGITQEELVNLLDSIIVGLQKYDYIKSIED